MTSLCEVVSKEFPLRKCRNITSIMQVFLLTANAMVVAALGKIDIIGYGNGDYHLTMILNDVVAPACHSNPDSGEICFPADAVFSSGTQDSFTILLSEDDPDTFLE